MMVARPTAVKLLVQVARPVCRQAMERVAILTSKKRVADSKNVLTAEDREHDTGRWISEETLKNGGASPHSP